jgi:ribonuclease/clavin/mitogillin
MTQTRDSSSLTIVDVGYRSTHYWVISAGTTRLLVDIGWPGTLGSMKANLERMGIPMEEIHYALATHYHMDHAGLGEELKHLGVSLLVIDLQVDAIPIMKTWMKPEDKYVEITAEGNVVISCDDSRQLLDQIGIPGEIVHTPGHSDDSVSLLLDNGKVFTGDLPAEAYCWDNPAALESWRRLRELGAQTIYPAHGPIRPIDSGPPQ